jgi:hypothetical protein
MGEPTKDNIVMPVALAKELDIQPQVVFGWIRRGLIEAHECVCGHKYLLRDEVAPFLEERAAKLEEKEAKEKAQIEKELEGAVA